MPYTKIAPERLKAGHKGDLAYLVGQKVKACVVQVRALGAGRGMAMQAARAPRSAAAGSQRGVQRALCRWLVPARPRRCGPRGGGGHCMLPLRAGASPGSVFS